MEIPVLPEPSNNRTVIYKVKRKGDSLEIDIYTAIKLKNKWWQGDKFDWGVGYYCDNKGYIVDGSGGQYAAGALEMGATGEEAIIAASRLDQYTGTEVDVVAL